MIENSYKTDGDTSSPDDRAAEAQGRRRLIRWIMLAVILWGGFLAIGAWLSSHDWRRPAIVVACIFAFLGFWQAMLSNRRRRDQETGA